jgi:hypothetical protein
MRAFLFRIELDRLTGIQRPFHAEIGNASMALYQLFWMAGTLSAVARIARNR